MASRRRILVLVAGVVRHCYSGSKLLVSFFTLTVAPLVIQFSFTFCPIYFLFSTCSHDFTSFRFLVVVRTLLPILVLLLNLVPVFSLVGILMLIAFVMAIVMITVIAFPVVTWILVSLLATPCFDSSSSC